MFLLFVIILLHGVFRASVPPCTYLQYAYQIIPYNVTILWYSIVPLLQNSLNTLFLYYSLVVAHAHVKTLLLLPLILDKDVI